MTVYMIADIKVTDNKWVPAYAASVHDLVHKHGGKYLSRSRNVKTLEGKEIVVFGKFVDYHGKAQIELTDPKQIKIVK